MVSRRQDWTAGSVSALLESSLPTTSQALNAAAATNAAARRERNMDGPPLLLPDRARARRKWLSRAGLFVAVGLAVAATLGRDVVQQAGAHALVLARLVRLVALGAGFVGERGGLVGDLELGEHEDH